jgi:hypothetical protein
MNRSKSYLTAFNNQVINIATELHEMYPNDKTFSFVVTAAKVIKSANPRLLYTNVITPMLEYREHVFNEDENFFRDVINEHVEKKAKEDDENACKTEEEKEQERQRRMAEENKTEEELEEETKKREENFNIVLRIRMYWEGMSEGTKKEIWKRLKVLYVLSDKLQGN